MTSLEIQIDEIEASDDGLTCVCKVAWKLPETMYNNARISLEMSFVLSVQGIAHKINLPLTFMIYISWDFLCLLFVFCFSFSFILIFSFF